MARSKRRKLIDQLIDQRSRGGDVRFHLFSVAWKNDKRKIVSPTVPPSPNHVESSTRFAYLSVWFALTNFLRLIVLNDLGQLHVPGDHGDLVRRLVRVIQTVLLRASEQQLAYARGVRVVHCANVQRCITRCVTRVHVGAVKKQVIQVLDQVVAAGLRTPHQVSIIEGDAIIIKPYFSYLPLTCPSKLTTCCSRKIRLV